MTWLERAWPQVLDLLGSHLLVALPAVALSALIAVPVGLFAHRVPSVGAPLLSALGILYSVPALPLVIIVPAIFATPLRSAATLIIALTVYGVALLVRTAADAFAAVDDTTREAARAVGHSSSSLFWSVDLPRALPLLISGIRVVSVSTVGLVTIGALIGVPSLGTLFTDGFQRGIFAEVATGLVLTIALALALDLVWVLVGRFGAPWQASQQRESVS
ncbi:MAG: ABC transporter permease [Pseudoclavibacter sp.]